MTWKETEKTEKNVFFNVCIFYGSLDSTENCGKVKRKKMEIPGFYYGIFIKYLYKLYKTDIHTSL